MADIEVRRHFRNLELGFDGRVRVFFPEIRQIVDAEVEFEAIHKRKERQAVHFHVSFYVAGHWRSGRLVSAVRGLFVGAAGCISRLAACLALLLAALLLLLAASLSHERQAGSAGQLVPHFALAVETAFEKVNPSFASLLVEKLDGLEAFGKSSELLFEVAVLEVQNEGQRQVVVNVQTVFLP